MTDYTFSYYLLGSPEATLDGSGGVKHDIEAVSERDGVVATVPGRHKSFIVPAADLQLVLNMPDGTGAQKQAKNQSYIALLKSNVNTAVVPNTGWGIDQLRAMMSANDASATAATGADDYIVNTLGHSWEQPLRLPIG